MHFSFHDLPFLAGIPIEKWEDGRTLVVSEDGRVFLRLNATTYQEVTAEFSEFRQAIELGEYAVVGYESGFHKLGLDSSDAAALTENIVLRPSEMSIGGSPPHADMGRKRVQLGPALGAVRHDTVDEFTLRLDSAGSQETSRDDGAQASRLELGIENQRADPSVQETSLNTSDSDQFPFRPDVVGQASAVPDGRQDARIEPAEHQASVPPEGGTHLLHKEPADLKPALAQDASHREFRPTMECEATVAGNDESYQRPPPKDDISADLKVGGDATYQLPWKEPSQAGERLHDDSHHKSAQDTLALQPGVKGKDESHQREFVECAQAADAFDSGDRASYHRQSQDDAGQFAKSIGAESGHQDRGVEIGNVEDTLASGHQLSQTDDSVAETSVAEGQQFQAPEPAAQGSKVEEGLQPSQVEIGGLDVAVEPGRQTTFAEQNGQTSRVATAAHETPATEQATVTAGSAEGRQESFETGSGHSAALEAGSMSDAEEENPTSRLRIEVGADVLAPPDSGVEHSETAGVDQTHFREVTDQTQILDGSNQAVQSEGVAQQLAASGAQDGEPPETVHAGRPRLAGTNLQTDEQAVASNGIESIRHDRSEEQSQSQLSLAETFKREQVEETAVGCSVMPGRKTLINFLRGSWELANLPANQFDGGANFNEHLRFSAVLQAVGPYTVDSDFAPWPLIPDFPNWYLPAPLTCDDEQGLWTADMDSFEPSF